jgi:type I restriction enzyme M protein
MAIKKSELYSTLWKSCDELRGGMDASQYKDYVLVLLFMKYVSDKAASNANYLLDVPPGARFADMVALKGNKNIGEEINKIIARLAEANDLKGVIDVADFNDPDKLGRGQEMVDRLTNLIAIFDKPELDFRGNRAEGDDLLGDAYEYLMRHFATESGKSKGQFYTPAEVSRVLAKVLGVRSARSANQTIYDPTCGSGSLLLKAHDEAQGATGLDLAIYGQEMDVATAALARMNMILHDAPTAEITPGGYSTLASPQFKARDGSLKTFDFVVANPPFSNKAWRNGFKPEEDEHKRFADPWTVPPAKNGDYAFLLHIIASMKSTGKAAVILPHGVLFRGNAEAHIRREIVRRGYIKGIIGLPANLFYGTSIPACVVVLDKAEAATRKGIFMIDAARGFMKDGAKNRLRAQDIHRIVDVFTRQVEEAHYSRFVPTKEIEANDFNLNIPRYLDSSDPADVQDLEAHVRGGIPQTDLDALQSYWEVFRSLRGQLFESIRPGYEVLRVEPGDVTVVVSQNIDRLAFMGEVQNRFSEWSKQASVALEALVTGDSVKRLGEYLSETLLQSFGSLPIVSAYDIYQRFMDYWSTTMQDDVYLISEAGWLQAAAPREVHSTATEKDPDFTMGRRRFKSDVLGKAVLIGRYFGDASSRLTELHVELAETQQALDDLVEEHDVEGGSLESVVDEKGRLTKRAVADRLQEIQSLQGSDEYDEDEKRVLAEAAGLLDSQATLKSTVKAADDDLNAGLMQKYGQLDAEEVRSLVISDKWLSRLNAEVNSACEQATERLTERLSQLGKRYEAPLPSLVAESERLTALVDEHIAMLGIQTS